MFFRMIIKIPQLYWLFCVFLFRKIHLHITLYLWIIDVFLCTVFRLWSFTRDKFHMCWKSYWRILCRFGNFLSNVSRLHNRTARWTHGHKIPLPKWNRFWSGNTSLWTCWRGGLYYIRKILLFESRTLRKYNVTKIW